MGDDINNSDNNGDDQAIQQIIDTLEDEKETIDEEIKKINDEIDGSKVLGKMEEIDSGLDDLVAQADQEEDVAGARDQVAAL